MKNTDIKSILKNQIQDLPEKSSIHTIISKKNVKLESNKDVNSFISLLKEAKNIVFESEELKEEDFHQYEEIEDFLFTFQNKIEVDSSKENIKDNLQEPEVKKMIKEMFENINLRERERERRELNDRRKDSKKDSSKNKRSGKDRRSQP